MVVPVAGNVQTKASLPHPALVRMHGAGPERAMPFGVQQPPLDSRPPVNWTGQRA